MLNRKLPTYNNKLFVLGKFKIAFGSVVATGSGKNYIKIHTESNLKSILGVSSFSNRNLYANYFNTDSAVMPNCAYGAEWWTGDGLYCYFSGAVSSGNNVRVNYLYVYCDE